MGLERLFRGSSVLQLPKRPLVDNIGVTCVVEQAGSNPGLQMAPGRGDASTKGIHAHAREVHAYFEQEPPAKVNPADLLRPILEARSEREDGRKASKESSKDGS
jgi:hypothetical protein